MITKEQQQAIEEAGVAKFPIFESDDSYFIHLTKMYRFGFDEGAKEVLSNPEKYGLFTKEDLGGRP